MAKRGGEFLKASERYQVAGRGCRVAQDEVLVGVFEAKRPMVVLEEASALVFGVSAQRVTVRSSGESARAAAMVSVCSHRSSPNQPPEPTRLHGAVLRERLLRSTVRSRSNHRDCARQRVAQL